MFDDSRKGNDRDDLINCVQQFNEVVPIIVRSEYIMFRVNSFRCSGIRSARQFVSCRLIKPGGIIDAPLSNYVITDFVATYYHFVLYNNALSPLHLAIKHSTTYLCRSICVRYVCTVYFNE